MLTQPHQKSNTQWCRASTKHVWLSTCHTQLSISKTTLPHGTCVSKAKLCCQRVETEVLAQACTVWYKTGTRSTAAPADSPSVCAPKCQPMPAVPPAARAAAGPPAHRKKGDPPKRPAARLSKAAGEPPPPRKDDKICQHSCTPHELRSALEPEGRPLIGQRPQR